MCKIIAFTNMSKIKLNQCVNDIGNTLLKTETDGFGYAVQGKLGVYGEKTIAPYFRTRIKRAHAIRLPIVKKRYESFGQSSDLTGPGMFHGRVSTNSEGLNNTHPMHRVAPDGVWYLIHNGVVSDHGPAYDKLTDNDSEDVLYRLIEGINSIETYLTGYYAFAAIDPEGQLHIARDAHATLYMAWSNVYETYIIATTESLINKINKIIDAKIGPIDEIEDNVYLIFKNNELVHHQTISPRGWSHVESVHSQSSLGRSLDGANVVTPASDEPVDEASWPKQKDEWDTALDVIQNMNNSEIDYYKYRNELDNMDASYSIWDENDNIIKLYEFKKLDHVHQELCTVIRADGTVVDIDGVIRVADSSYAI